MMRSTQCDDTDFENYDEGTRCSAGLMCRGLTIRDEPAHVGHYLEADYDTGYDHLRVAVAFKFPEDPDGMYCEDCTIHLEEENL